MYIPYEERSCVLMNIRRATEEDVQGIAHVHVETWRSAYKGIIPDAYLDSLTIENRTKNWRRNLKTLHTVIFVAENEYGDIIGFAAGGPEQTRDPYYQAELYAIYLLDTYQQKGIGKQLVKSVVAFLATKNYNNIIIWALAENENRLFYESLGGQIVSSKSISIYKKELTAVGYGWNRLVELVNRL